MAKLVFSDLQIELTAYDLNCVAAVSEGPHATDHAVHLSATRLAVVRSVERLTPEDHTALATMISEGDFIWGAVVYEQGEAPSSPGLIESFHVSQLDELVARLVALREALSAAHGAPHA